MMEAARSSKTLVNFYQTTWCYNPEDSHLHYLLQIFRAMMEAAMSSETLVNFYQTTQRYNPENSHLRTNHHVNLKSYL
jgi:hypothetical protein